MADQEDPDVDPVEFLFTNTKYHDCHLTVGNPLIDDVENIGVSSTHLIAHSSVFREMLAESELADPSGANTHIKDVSPATFKLMLRHVYGGKLPKLTSEEAAELAFCADKFNISRLLGKATKRLKPTNTDDFFFALKVVVYIKCPDLEKDVIKFVEKETNEIVQNPKFLELDENKVLFIVKQNTLNIREVEVWNSIVRWVENQVKNNPESKNVRELLSEILPHIRLLTLSVEEITNHVLPTKILNEKESVDLILTLSGKQDIQIPGLSNSRASRAKRSILEEAKFSVKAVKPYQDTLIQCAVVECSTIILQPRRNLEMSSITLKAFNADNKNYNVTSNYNLKCEIEICESSFGVARNGSNVTLQESVIPYQTVTLNVDQVGNKFTIEANKEYSLKITTSPPLPSFKIDCRTGRTKCFPVSYGTKDILVYFMEPFHILEIAYKVLE